MKTSLRVLLIIILAVAGVGLCTYVWYQPNQDGALSDNDFIYVITQHNRHLIKENSPVIEVVEVKQLAGNWYLVSLKSIRDEENAVPVRAIFKWDDKKNLRLVAGPENHFTEAELLRYNIPDAAILELQK